MSIQKGVQQALLSQAAITALTQNIYVNTIPQVKQLPAIVIRKTGGDMYNTFDGGDYDEMKAAYFEIESIALSESVAIAIADQIMESMCDYVGAADDQTILATIHQDEEGDVEDSGNGSAKDYHSEIVRFLFQYVRT